MHIAAGNISRLMISMPPRHGKSEFASKYFPAWFVGTQKEKRVILTSYEANFAASWGRKARDVLEEYGKEVFDVKVRSDSHASDRWDLEGHDGGMSTAGVGGPITGKGAHVLIIDDPVKNSEESRSKVIRDKQWDWYLGTAYTRLEPGGAIILIMTRWNEDDLEGRLVQMQDLGGEHWEQVIMPAIAEDGLPDTLERPVGYPLWPERYNLDRLEEIKTTVGSYWWYALYQQKPQPASGTIFQRSWFRYFFEEDRYYILEGETGQKRIEKGRCWRFQTVDPAATEDEQSDYFALATWAVTPDRELLLLDVFREKAETVKHKMIMKTNFQRWAPGFQGVEKKTFGLNIIQDCKREGLPIRPISADADKVSRARPMAARYETGMVYHRKNAPWLTAWEDELLEFPNGAHDDQVDTASMAGNEIAGPGNVQKPGGKPRGY